MKKLIIIALLYLLLPSISMADDEKLLRPNFPLTTTTQFCVTDDASLENRMVRCDTNGYTKVTLGTAISNAIDSIAVYPPNPSNNNITTNVSTQVKSSSGYLLKVIIGTAGTASSAIIYDNTACSGTIIGTISTTAQASLAFDTYFSTGLCITTSGTAAANLTIIWK